MRNCDAETHGTQTGAEGEWFAGPWQNNKKANGSGIASLPPPISKKDLAMKKKSKESWSENHVGAAPGKRAVD